MSRRHGQSGQIAQVREAGGDVPSTSLRLSLAWMKKARLFELPALPAPVADTHAHLMSFWKVDPVSALARAAAAGVAQLTTIWDPLADARCAATAPAFHDVLEAWVAEARDLFERGVAEGAIDGGSAAPQLFDHIRYLAGVHPYGAPRYDEAVHARVAEALDDPLCAGIGEIGLDYHFDADDDIEAAPHDVQIACFERQLALACARNVPVELHVRNDGADEARAAHADAYRVLSEVGIPAAGCVLHCFTEDRATMERFVELGCHIAFGGAATFKRNADIREAFAACPLDRILFETDCPYMAPEPLRGIECEPALIAFTATALAQDRSERTGEDPAAIMRAAWENATALFAG